MDVPLRYKEYLMTKKPGLNLADLAPMSEDVAIGDSFLTVHGVSAKAGLEIFKRFPKILGMVSGDGFNLGAFLTVAPDAVAAIIAAASGDLGNEAAEEAASNLSVEAQFDILEAVGRLTFTKGFAPFVERIMALVGAANSGLSSKVPDMNSLPASKPSSPPDTPPT
jgi:hypothetical protein